MAQEAADVIYHLLVLLASLDVSLVSFGYSRQETGRSGLEEKASRRAAEHKGVTKGD